MSGAGEMLRGCLGSPHLQAACWPPVVLPFLSQPPADIVTDIALWGWPPNTVPWPTEPSGRWEGRAGGSLWVGFRVGLKESLLRKSEAGSGWTPLSCRNTEAVGARLLFSSVYFSSIPQTFELLLCTGAERLLLCAGLERRWRKCR